MTGGFRLPVSARFEQLGVRIVAKSIILLRIVQTGTCWLDEECTAGA